MRARARAIDFSYALVLLTGLALLLGSPSRVSAQAQACTAGCGSTESLDPNVLDVGDSTEFSPFVTNVSRISAAPFTAVAAELRCVAQDPNSASISGGCCLRLACLADPGITEADCLNDSAGGNDGLPGTFSVVSAVINPALVGQLTALTVSTDENTVCVEGVVQLAAGQMNLPLFTVDATAEQPVLSNGGNFFSAFSAPSAVVTNTTITSACNNQTTGSCATSATGSVTPTCEVVVDKQVSCDGGVTWLDQGLVEANDDGTNDPCEGWNAFDGMPAEDIMIRYQARNDGNLELSCTFTESNPEIPAVVFPTIIPVGPDPFPVDFVSTQDACSDLLDDAEPDTATLDCTCPESGELNLTDVASDEASFVCLQPTLNVQKMCVDGDQDGTDDGVSIMVANAGTADLANCVVTDTLDLDEDGLDPACNAGTELLGDGFTPGPTQAVAVANIASLAAMTSETVTGTITPELEENACNLASVTCDVVGSGGKTITAQDDDTCIVKPLCDVQVDKQIDAGIGFVDVSDFCDESLDPDPGEGLCAGGPDAGDPCDPTVANACRTIGQAIGWTGEPVDFKFIVKNTGEARVRCTVTDNKITDPIITEVIIPPGGTQEMPIDETCRAELTPSDTATLSCECLDDQDVVTETVGDTDTVNLACQTPGITIDKLCAEQVEDTNVVTICPGLDPDECKNTGTATLINCMVTDDLCAQTFGVGTLAPGATYGPFTCNVVGLTEEADNTATITCEISDDGTPTGNPVIDPCIAGTCMVGGVACEVDADCGSKKVTATALDPCEVTKEECITRTPGFWCTHPTVTDLFLDPPLTVCGLPLDNVMVATAGSAIEDVTPGGNDFKAASTSPQQLHLIRQCTAAALNQAASLDNEGDCAGNVLNSSTFGDVFEECCTELCPGATAAEIDGSGCIGLLDTFNNSEDTFTTVPAPFDSLGTAICPIPDGATPTLTNACSAQPARCQAANGNGFVNPRTLGPGSGPPPKPPKPPKP